MNRTPRRRRLGRYFDLPSRWRWVVWPVVALGGGGTALTLWLKEVTITVADCLPLGALPGMAALLYWFNHLVFKATPPCRKDLLDKTNSQDRPL